MVTQLNARHRQFAMSCCLTGIPGNLVGSVGSGGGTPDLRQASTSSYRSFCHSRRCSIGIHERQNGKMNAEMKPYERLARTSSSTPYV